ncbi:MAG: hypothetical protein WCP60_09045 [bacterium]
MKHTKSILMAALAAITIGSIGSASAEVIYITGSTAFRKAANKALQTALGAGNIAASDSATSLTDVGAGTIYFTNCTVNGQTVDVAASWTGSESGIQSVASPSTNVKTIPFLDITKLTANGLVGTFGTNISSGVNFTTMVGNSNTTSVRATLTFSDTFQGKSVFTGTGVKDGLVYTALSEPYTNGLGLGVVPFTFVANTSCPYTNITTPIFADIATGNGYVLGSEFTGNGADTNIRCFLTGRNIDSGTRLTSFLVGKIGTQPTTVTQYDVTASGGVITALPKAAAVTINGVSSPVWFGGQSSGGSLCKYMTNTVSPTVTVGLGAVARGSATNYLIGYAGVSDACGQVANGLKMMAYNGYLPRNYNQSTTTNIDAGYSNTISGAYPFWGYEHLYYNSTIASAQATNLAYSISTNVLSLPSTDPNLAPNIALSEMKVSRTTDGGPIK